MHNVSGRSAFVRSFIHSFIHSFRTISIAPLEVHYYSEALPTQHEYCSGVSHRSATSNYKLRTCPMSLYVTARAGFETMTLQLTIIDPTNAPPCPTAFTIYYGLIFKLFKQNLSE